MHFAISGFVGHNGHGKTLRMVEWLALPSFAKGRPVVANFRLYPERVGADASLYIPLRSWRDIARCGTHFVTLVPDEVATWEQQYFDAWGHLLGPGPVGSASEITDEGHLVVPRLNADGSLYSITGNVGAVLLLDEINSVMPSRGYASMPPELLRVVNQLRKQDTIVGWTAPAWERADVALREVTTAVHVCRGYFPDRWERDPYHRAFRPRAVRDEGGKRVRWTKGWPPRRLFKFSIYDAVEYEAASLGLGQDQRVQSVGVTYRWRSRHDAQIAYGSADAVLLLDHLDAVGTCVTCDGSRTRHKCTCPKPDGATRSGAVRRSVVTLPSSPVPASSAVVIAGD